MIAKLKILLNFTIILPFLLLFNVSNANAQATNSANISNDNLVSDTKAIDGDILIKSNQGIIRAEIPYSNNLIGILHLKSSTANNLSNDLDKSVIKTGTVKVNVTTINGNIRSGDRITSSSLAGKGQKSTESGYNLGIALEDFDENTGQRFSYLNRQYSQGQIFVMIKIGYQDLNSSRSSLDFLKIVTLETFDNIKDPHQSTIIFQYLAAVIVIVAGFIIGFLKFSKSIAKSIEVLGRQPSAKKIIQSAINVNIILMILITIITLIIAVMILKL